MIEKLFFELIQVAMGNRTCLTTSPTPDEWQSLFEMATKQALVGICSVAVERLKAYGQQPPQPLLWEWIATVTEIQLRNERLDKQCAKLQKKLLEDGYRSCILKGQGIALYYPQELSSYRQPGDIDIWIDAPRDRVLEYVMRTYPNRSFDAKHIHYNIFHDTEVEIHWVPSYSCVPSVNRKLKLFFEKQREEQMTHSIKLHSIPINLITPTATFNASYILNHIFGHFLYEGIGLRQIMDLYYVLLRIDNKQEVIAVWKSLGLCKIASSVMYVMYEVFGLQENSMICRLDKKGGKLLLKEIMEEGNFGCNKDDNLIIKESMWCHVKRRLSRRLSLINYDPKGIFWRPIFRLRLEWWKREVWRKYRLD